MSEMQDRIRNLKARLPIDRTRLDGECVEQADLYATIGEIATELKRDARTAKEFLDFEKARIRRLVRENPGAYGVGGKQTESSVDDAVVTNMEYQSAQKAYTDAQYLADCAGVLVAAAEQRKSMIKDAVTLFVHEYFSTKDDLAPQRVQMSHVTEDRINNLRRQDAVEQQMANLTEEGQGVVTDE